jgi:hypothetical protein
VTPCPRHLLLLLLLHLPLLLQLPPLLLPPVILRSLRTYR